MHTNVLSTIVISLLLLALTSCSSSKQMACPSFGSNKMVTKKNKRHRSFHFEISGVFKNNKSQSKRFYPSYLSFKTKSLQFDAIQLRETLKPGVIRPQSIATSKKENKHTIKMHPELSIFRGERKMPVGKECSFPSD